MPESMPRRAPVAYLPRMTEELLRWGLGILITSGTLAAALAFLGKRWIESQFARGEERFRAELRREVDQELERYRSELAIARSEHEERFRFLHGRRADNLERLYSAFVDAIAAVENAAAALRLSGHLQNRSEGQLEEAYRRRIEVAHTAVKALASTAVAFRPMVPDGLESEISDAVGSANRLLFAVLNYDTVTENEPAAGSPAEQSAGELLRRAEGEAYEAHERLVRVFRAEFSRGIDDRQRTE